MAKSKDLNMASVRKAVLAFERMKKRGIPVTIAPTMFIHKSLVRRDKYGRLIDDKGKLVIVK